MLKFIKFFIQNDFCVFFPIAVFVSVAVFNSFEYVGLIEDGNHHFWEALVSENIWVGHEGFGYFPYNSRYFPSLLQHLSVGIPVMFGMVNIKNLLFIFTFTSYFIPVILLILIYANIPEKKKDDFGIILFSFIVSMLFMMYQIWTENLITGLFIWIIFVIYYYADFGKLSILNVFCLEIFSLALVSSHPMSAVFLFPLIVFAVTKHIKTKNIPLKYKIPLIISYCLLICAFIFNLYFILYPIYPKDDYFKFEVFKNPVFMRFLIFISVVLTLSLFRWVRFKYASFIIFVTGCFWISYYMLWDIDPSVCYTFRIFGFYVPLFFMIFLIFKDVVKITPKYKYIKITNTVLAVIIFVNAFYYGISWKKYIENINDYLINNKTVDIMHTAKYGMFHFHRIPYIVTLIPPLFGSDVSCKLEVSDNNLFCGHIKKIKKYKERLALFNIDVDKVL